MKFPRSPFAAVHGVAAARLDAQGVRDTIDAALRLAGLPAGTVTPRSGAARSAVWHDALSHRAGRQDVVVDVLAREVPTPANPGPKPAPAAEPAAPGRFLACSFTGPAGHRSYKLYVPGSYRGQPLPLLVMLHGCTQSPDDFAAGTRMNELAEQHGLLVVYPEQAVHANRSRCWNWFQTGDQGREGGEPAVIAGITREVAQQYAVDERRIFVAGLSAGAAMAVILGQTHPEIYAGVGAHSGLPYAAAHDVASAFAAMAHTPVPGNGAGPSRRSIPIPIHAAPARVAPRITRATPTIVFHGDQDTTVHARNGATIVAQSAALAGAGEGADLRNHTQQGIAAGGRRYSRTLYSDAGGQARLEHWVVHGAGHAWSGGSTDGSYTDPAGPDASTEMIRFFLSLERGGTA